MFSFSIITSWGLDLDRRDIECFALEMNRDRPIVFEMASKYCILDSFVDYGGYSIVVGNNEQCIKYAVCLILDGGEYN